VIIVTGANSGIGAAIEKQLVEEGLNVKNSHDFLPVTNCCVMGLRPFCALQPEKRWKLIMKAQRFRAHNTAEKLKY
jgi:nucleoside-diphosphate-sugar epimerase